MNNKDNKILLLTELFRSFQTGIRSAKALKAKAYLSSIGLSYESFNLGFNSGQFHHRESETYKKDYESIGVLTHNPNVVINKEGRVAYTVFGNYSIAYTLKNGKGEIVNLFADRFNLETPQRLFLYKGSGIFPSYPKANTKKLFVCYDPIEAETLLQSGILKNEEAVISLFNGEISQEIEIMLNELEGLQQIVFISQEEEPKAQVIISNQLPHIEVAILSLEQNHTLNDMWVNYPEKVFTDFINGEHQEIIETSNQKLKKLQVISPQKIIYRGQAANYEILGGLPPDLGIMTVSLKILHKSSLKRPIRSSLNLFNNEAIQNEAKKCAHEEYNSNLIVADLQDLADCLELHRDKMHQEENSNFLDTASKKEMTPEAEREAMEFLSKENLIPALKKMIGSTGIVGEELTSLLVFIIASSYKMPATLHGLVQASSGKGKSHLINHIVGLMPQEDLLNFSRITSKALYNYKNNELMYKIIAIQDEEGLSEESLYALRELQSAGYLGSSTSSKNIYGKHQSQSTYVRGHFSSLMATTKNAIYFDNESRSILIGIDESEAQTQRIIQYNNEIRAGLHDNKEEKHKAGILLRNCMRVLKSKEVINPFAHKINLPVEAMMRRRLNEQFQDVIAQITRLHQYQREEDENQRLITTPEDIKAAIEIFFSAIMLKVDELDSSTRQYYNFLLETFKGKTFTRREVREQLRLKNTKSNQLLNHLVDMEYLYREGSSNKGFNYSFTRHEDKAEKTKQKIKKELFEQVDNLLQ